MNELNKKISVTDYDNYREYLSDWYALQKKLRRNFSFRNFSKRAGFKSPNFLKLVMDGDRNLSAEGIDKFILGLQINKADSDCFRHLVNFNQAELHEEKIKAYKQLISSQKYCRLKPIEKDRFDYFSTWYHPIIRELILHKNFDGSPEWLVKKIGHRLSLKQAEKSLEVLQHLGFIKQTETKKWEQTEPVITTGAESSALTLLEYHRSLLQLAESILPDIASELRDVSSLAMGIKQNQIPQLKESIRNFRAQIIKQFSIAEPPEQVYYLNIQLLPMTE